MGIKTQKFSNAWDGVAYVFEETSSVILAGTPAKKLWLFYQVMKQRSCVMNAVKKPVFDCLGENS